ncbi:hypothetical protein LTR12_017111 [Friedmanniomyces endolithicus]|nr:hypothetical protein LTR12_017111 [Friedmanniomyces endolithicus]
MSHLEHTRSLLNSGYSGVPDTPIGTDHGAIYCTSGSMDFESIHFSTDGTDPTTRDDADHSRAHSPAASSTEQGTDEATGIARDLIERLETVTARLENAHADLSIERARASHTPPTNGHVRPWRDGIHATFNQVGLDPRISYVREVLEAMEREEERDYGTEHYTATIAVAALTFRALNCRLARVDTDQGMFHRFTHTNIAARDDLMIRGVPLIEAQQQVLSVATHALASVTHNVLNMPHYSGDAGPGGAWPGPTDVGYANGV